MKKIRHILREVSDEGKLMIFGDASPSEETVDGLRNEIDLITAAGYDLSLIMIDLDTRSGISYRSDHVMCYQSTIKAIYVAALLEEKPELFVKHQEMIRKTIVLSDNNTYKELRDTYGNEPLLRWCRDCGIDEGFADRLYPRDRCAKELCILWTKMYSYLESGKAPKELISYLADSVCSSAREVLSDRCFVQSKAGWENGLSEDMLYTGNMFYPPELTDKDPSN
ncbi:MAG: hypothetical protein IKS69_06285, partial [Erysipelotrichaceae bacterium]|nr:hypothetical protein [Erysipelotrichaceae bacterium]